MVNSIKAYEESEGNQSGNQRLFRRFTRLKNEPPLMRRLDIHKSIPVSDTKLTMGLRVGFISFHLTADKLFPVNPKAIRGPPKMSLLLEVKSMPALIIETEAYIFCIHG